LNLDVIPNSELISIGISGVRNKTKIGVAKQMNIDKVAYSNVIFSIFPDSALTVSFSGGGKTNAIVGLPVITAFEEFSISNNHISISQYPVANDVSPNFILDRWLSIIYLNYKEKGCPVVFDSGDESGKFYDNFYSVDSIELNKVSYGLRRRNYGRYKLDT